MKNKHPVLTIAATTKAAMPVVTANVANASAHADTAGNGDQKGMAAFTIAKGGLMYAATVAGPNFTCTPRIQ